MATVQVTTATLVVSSDTLRGRKQRPFRYAPFSPIRRRQYVEYSAHAVSIPSQPTPAIVTRAVYRIFPDYF